MIGWCVNMIKRSIKKDVKVDPFIQNFGSAILPCIIHAPTTLEYLET